MRRRSLLSKLLFVGSAAVVAVLLGKPDLLPGTAPARRQYVRRSSTPHGVEYPT